MTDSPFEFAPAAPDHRILRSIIVPLTAAIIALLVAVVAGVYGLIQSEDTAQVEKTVAAAASLLRVQMEEEEETLKVGLAGILGSPALAAPLRAGDRDRLMQIAEPIYAAMRANGQVTHFYFGAADGTTILRVHAPNAFGDRYDHGLSAKAAHSGKAEAGLDLGKLGALSLRVSTPYRDNGEVIAFIQQGVEFKHIADTLHQVLGIHILTILDKRHLAQAEWERGQAYFGWPLPWEHFPAMVLNNSTMPSLPGSMLRHIANGPSDGNFTPGYVTENGRIFYLAPLPLLDEAGERLGSLVVVVDRTSLTAGSRILLGGIVLLCLVVGAVLVVLFRRIVARVERRIESGIAGLARTNADLERVAFMACHDLQEPLDQVITASLELQRRCSRLDADCGRQLHLVNDGAQRLEHAVGTLEDYLDLDISARQAEAVELDAIFAAALEKVLPLTAEDHVTATPLPKVTGRPILLARAILCILDYALKARPTGGSLQLKVWAEAGNGVWHIWFAGFAPDLTACAVSPEDSVKLATARSIAQLHGGNLTSVSTPHHGAAILLTLRR